MKHSLHIKKLVAGGRILFVNVPGSSSYYFNTICNAGHYYVEKSKYELPHLLEHLAFVGSKKYPNQGQISHELEKLGGLSNAHTNRRLIRYFFFGSISDYIKITELALEQFTQPLFLDNCIKEQKQVVERELRRKISDDGIRAGNLTYSKLFPGEICFAQDRIDTIKNITREDIIDYFKKTHTQTNTCFVIAGDLNEKNMSRITKLVNTYINELPLGKKLSRLNKLSEGFARTVNILPSQIEGQMYIDFGFVKKHYNPDVNYQAACDVATAIYNRGDGSRIFRKARLAGLSYGVSAGITNDKEFSDLYINDKTEPQLSAKLFDLCIKELLDISNGGFSKEELIRAKGFMAGGDLTNYETSRDLADWYGPSFVDGEDLYSPSDLSAAIRKVQKNDVINILQSFIGKDNWIVSIVGKDAEKYKPEFEKIANKYF